MNAKGWVSGLNLVCTGVVAALLWTLHGQIERMASEQTITVRRYEEIPMQWTRTWMSGNPSDEVRVTTQQGVIPPGKLVQADYDVPSNETPEAGYARHLARVARAQEINPPN